MADENPIPDCDLTDPASVDAWFGRNQLFAHVRKVKLALCRELERAKCEASNERYTVDKIDDRARLHPLYVGFLLHCLEGARIREELWREAQRAT